MTKLLGTLVLGTLVMACGADSSGVDSSKRLLDLESGEIGDVCDYTADVQGGYGSSKVCGDGITFTVQSRAECIADIEATASGCTATVGDMEACSEAVGEDLCKFLSEPKCSFLFQCVGE